MITSHFDQLRTYASQRNFGCGCKGDTKCNKIPSTAKRLRLQNTVEIQPEVINDEILDLLHELATQTNGDQGTQIEKNSGPATLSTCADAVVNSSVAVACGSVFDRDISAAIRICAESE